MTKRPRRAIIAHREDGEEPVVSLTPNPLHEALGNPRWSLSDGYVTWIGQIWDDATDDVAEAGIYGLEVLFDGGGAPQFDGEPVLLVEGRRTNSYDGNHSAIL